LGAVPPQISVVLSLREDYVGFLEEAADSIPKILDCRFRLTPLSVTAATEAMAGPAAVENPAFQARPFRYAPDASMAILNFLSRKKTGFSTDKSSQVEPFHLQLICRRVEETVLARQLQGAQDVEVLLDDLGGERNLGTILRDFFE